MALHVSAPSVQPVTAALTLRAEGPAVELLSASCRTCSPCSRGFPDHCQQPGPPGVAVAWETGGTDPAPLAAMAVALTAVELLARSGHASPRVGIVGHGEPLHLTRACLAAGGVDALVADPAGELTKDEVRRLSSLLRVGGARGAGPPDVVVSLDGDLALASRLVRRGGAIASAGPKTSPVPMAALVQRELTVVPTRDTAMTAAGSPHLRTVGAWARREDVPHG